MGFLYPFGGSGDFGGSKNHRDGILGFHLREIRSFPYLDAGFPVNWTVLSLNKLKSKGQFTQIAIIYIFSLGFF